MSRARPRDEGAIGGVVKRHSEIFAALITTVGVIAAAYIGKAADVFTFHVGSPEPSATVTIPVPGPTVTVTASPPPGSVPGPGAAVGEVLWGPREILIDDLTNVDFDESPPTLRSGGGESDLNWSATVPPSISASDGVANWASADVPTAEQCADRVSTHGLVTVTADDGDTVCVRTGLDNIASIQIQRFNKTDRTMSAIVTVWKGEET